MTTKTLIRGIQQTTMIWLFYLAGAVQMKYFEGADPVAGYAFSIAIGLLAALFVLYINRNQK